MKLIMIKGDEPSHGLGTMFHYTFIIDPAEAKAEQAELVSGFVESMLVKFKERSLQHITKSTIDSAELWKQFPADFDPEKFMSKQDRIAVTILNEDVNVQWKGLEANIGKLIAYKTNYPGTPHSEAYILFPSGKLDMFSTHTIEKAPSVAAPAPAPVTPQV